MSGSYAEAAKEMLRARAVSETFRNTLSPQQRVQFDEAVRRFQGLADEDDSSAEQILDQVKREADLEWATRRTWARKIREEFAKYHEHSGSGECGSCGAIQAANFMDPDYTEDGEKQN